MLILRLQPGVFNDDAGLVGKGGKGIDVFLGQFQTNVVFVGGDQANDVLIFSGTAMVETRPMIRLTVRSMAVMRGSLR